MADHKSDNICSAIASNPQSYPVLSFKLFLLLLLLLRLLLSLLLSLLIA
ncbi:MAG: hypothetical protein MUF72_15345 [Elainella sp. Prado103]|nr:hypothetical protein [Elainella sp. Prado103]